MPGSPCCEQDIGRHGCAATAIVACWRPTSGCAPDGAPWHGAIAQRGAVSAALLHGDDHAVGAEGQGHAVVAGRELQKDAVLVSQGQHALARTHGDARAGLHEGPGELGNVLQIVDLPRRGEVLNTDAADAEPADAEGILLALELQDAAAGLAADDEGKLGAIDLDPACKDLLLVSRRRLPTGHGQACHD